MVSGFGDGMMAVAVPAIIVIEFTDDTEFYLGLCNTSLGVGLMLGPVIGVFVYSVLSYANTFYFFSALILLVGNVSVSLVPKRLDEK